MLSTTYDFLRRKNPYVDVRLFGQEINPESYAICLADMLIKGQDVKNIMGDEEANTCLLYTSLMTSHSVSGCRGQIEALYHTEPHRETGLRCV